LLDENLSPRLVERLATIGIYAAHVAHLGLSGRSDPALFRYAYENDFIVVTINAADFLTLAAAMDAHPGVIVLRVSGLSINEQWEHLLPAPKDCLGRSSPQGDMLNHVIEIIGVGRFHRQPLPGPGLR
jgi:predicted nuclease of predicted toxin-antitoxin system